MHNHCQGGCCRQEGKSESGTVSIGQGGVLVFQIEAGAEVSRDGCNAALNRQAAISPQRESYPWRIRLDPIHDNAPTSCWNTGPNESTCYVKRP